MKKLFILFAGLPQILFAGGFQLNVQNSTQLGMGGAGTALFPNASVLFANPGAMCFLKKSIATINFSTIFPSTVYVSTLYNSETVYADAQVFTPFSAFAVYKKSDTAKWAAGVGVYTPFGSGVRWPDDWPGNNVLREIYLQTIFYQPTFSYQINQNFGAGFGFVYGTGSMLLRQGLPLYDSLSKQGSAELNGKATGIGYNLGMEYRVSARLQFGFNFRSGMTLRTTKTSAEFSTPSALNDSFPSTTFDAEIKLPAIIQIGGSVLIGRKFLIAADLQFSNWHVYDSLFFDYAANNSLLEDTRLARNYINTFTTRIGFQFSANRNIQLRAGGYIDQTPVQDGFVSPDLPDATRYSFSTGFTIQLNNKFDIDGAYEYVHTPERNGIYSEMGLAGIYRTNVAIANIGLTYRF